MRCAAINALLLLPGSRVGRLPYGVPVAVAMAAGPEWLARDALAKGEVGRALTVLMESYGDEIYRHCLAMVGTAAQAADVHQTVFVQAYRDLPRYRGDASMRTWLYAIARHRCLDALRARRRWLRRFVSGPAPEVASEGLEEATDAKVRARALRAALAELDPEVRHAVVLRYQEGMSFQEMSEICGARPKTLQARVARALPVLRRHLERAGLGGQS